MTRNLFIVATPQIAASLSEHFEALPLPASLPAPGESARLLQAAAQAALFDAAVCDAPALAKQLRDEGFDGAIVLIDASAPEADASLSRPLRLVELLAALERPGDPAAARGNGARLTEKEAAILDRLVAAGGSTIPKAALLADVWGYAPNVSTRTLETHIHRLRRKLEADPTSPRKLLTGDGGYRLANN